MSRRLLALMKRDLAAGLRDFILVYALVAPFLLALILRAFVPAIGGLSVNLIVTPEIGADVVARLEDYGRVEVVTDRSALDRRVLALDDAAGIVRDGGTWRVVLEGNEAEATAVLPGLILADIEAADAGGVTAETRIEIARVDLGRTASPLRPVLAIILAMMAMFMGGMFIGFNIIEDKETGTLTAMGVTPMSRFEYVAGRSLLGLVLSVVLVFGGLYTFGAGPFDPGQVLVVSVAGAFLAVIYGLYTGSISENQISGIAAIKFGALFFLLGPILTAVLPAKWHVLLYWLPTYWTYLGFKEALAAGAAAWSEVLRLSGISLAVSLVFLAASWRLLRRRLSLRG